MNLTKNTTRILIFVFLGLVGPSCFKDTVNTSFSFLVKDDIDEPIDQANIFINGSQVGQTDAKGIFVYSETFDAQKKIKIEIIKESERYFFSDHKEVVDLPKAPNFKKHFTVSLSFSPKKISLVPTDQTTLAQKKITPLPQPPVIKQVKEVVPSEKLVVSVSRSSVPVEEPVVPVPRPPDPVEEPEIMPLGHDQIADPTPVETTNALKEEIDEEPVVVEEDSEIDSKTAPLNDEQPPSSVGLKKKLPGEKIVESEVPVPKVEELPNIANITKIETRIVPDDELTKLKDQAAFDVFASKGQKRIGLKSGRRDGNGANGLMLLQFTPDSFSLTKQNANKKELTFAELRKLSVVTKQVRQVKKKRRKYSFFISVQNGQGKDVAGASIATGWPHTGFYEKAGVTDNGGRFKLSYYAPKSREALLFITKRNYVPYKTEVTVQPQGTLKVVLEKAIAINVRAFTQEFNYQKGVAGVAVYLDQKLIGKTGRFGFFSHPYMGKKGDLVNVRLEAANHFPNSYSADVVVANTLNIRKAFQNQMAPIPKVGLVKIHQHIYGNKFKQPYLEKLKDQIYRALSTQVYSLPCLQAVKNDRILVQLVDRGLNLPDIVENGWVNTELNPFLDVIIIPELIIANDIKLFLNAYTSTGKNIFSIYQPLTGPKSVESVAKLIAHKFKKDYPFEGIIKRKISDGLYRVNLGSKDFPGVRKGDMLGVFGVQYGPDGKDLFTSKIGELIVLQVKAEYSLAKLTSLFPRSEINIGDRIVRQKQLVEPAGIVKNKRNTTLKNNNNLTIIIRRKGGENSPVSGVNLYQDQIWVGTSDQNGEIEVAQLPGKSVTFLAHRFGFVPLEKTVTGSKNGRKPLVLKIVPKFSSIIISSVPNGKKLFVEDVFVGLTPILNPLEIPIGIRKIRIEGGKNYKDWQTVVEVTSALVNFSGARSVRLEKDYVRTAKSFEQQGDYKKALLYYQKVGTNESDFPKARNAMGSLYLGQFNDPERAVEEFEKVLQVPNIKALIDKKFVVTYANNGAAYFKIANRLFEKDPKSSARYFKKAYENFQNAEMFSSYFPKESYEKIRHQTLYFLALTYHKIYYLTHRKGFLQKALNGWKNYLDFVNFYIKDKGEYKKPFENAQVYLAEASASIKSKH